MAHNNRNSGRVIAIGDLHGDYNKCRTIFRDAGIVDQSGAWSFGSNTVIQTGDVLDRGDEGHRILIWLKQLSHEAAAHGGELIRLLGNHEMMNYMGDFRFVSPEERVKYKIHSKGREYDTDIARGGSLAQLHIAPNGLQVVVVREGTVFVHAGLNEFWSRYGVQVLNERMEKSLQSGNFQDPILSESGPVWNRAVIYAAQEGRCEMVTAALEALSASEVAAGRRKVHRMVVGHTIQATHKLTEMCGGALWGIDICMSRAMCSEPSYGYLELIENGDKAAAHYGTMVQVQNAVLLEHDKNDYVSVFESGGGGGTNQIVGQKGVISGGKNGYTNSHLGAEMRGRVMSSDQGHNYEIPKYQHQHHGHGILYSDSFFNSQSTGVPIILYLVLCLVGLAALNKLCHRINNGVSIKKRRGF